jgi:triosephosphate isomerase
MHKTVAEALAYVEIFAELLPAIPNDVELVICPPFTALAGVHSLLVRLQHGEGRIKLGAQNMHWEPSGAFTGEISAPMLLELGVQYVILGHSERRQYFGETDAYVRRRTSAALANGLTPIVAVGENLEIRRAGKAEEHCVAQTRAALDGLAIEDVRNVVIAYEPIWAIGTGENCDPAAANDAMRAIRESVPGLEEAPILYGGSVKPENMAQYSAQSEIDGALVGGASLDPQTFTQIAVALARDSAR